MSEPGRQLGGRCRQPGSDADANREVEGAALAFDTVQPDAAAHQFDQALADHQAEAGTAIAPGGRGIGLAEGGE